MTKTEEMEACRFVNCGGHYQRQVRGRNQCTNCGDILMHNELASLSEDRRPTVPEGLVEAYGRLAQLAADTGPDIAPYKDHRGFGRHDKLREDLRTLLATLSPVSHDSRLADETDPAFAAASYLTGIDDPIRFNNDRGEPFLAYSGQHIVNAFKAGFALRIEGKPS